MRGKIVAAAAAGLVLAAFLARPAGAQEWAPPSKEMPQMPTTALLDGGWQSELGSWFRGVSTSSLRAVGEGAQGGRARFVRFTGGVRPVATWADRNGDGRADMIEIFRGGAKAFQLIDADYDGTANVLRIYDASGNLQREERL